MSNVSPNQNLNILENLEKLFDFLHQVTKLKSTFRFSEVKNMPKESTADHSWRLALMVFIIAEELKLNLNLEKAMKIAIVHDLAESVTGDIDYRLIAEGKVSKQDKQASEINAMKRLKGMLSTKSGDEVYGLWCEYENSSTHEAKFVKALDKLETLTQLVEAGHRVYDKPELIANYADKAVKDFPELTDMLKILKQRLKAEFKKGKILWRREYDNL